MRYNVNAVRFDGRDNPIGQMSKREMEKFAERNPGVYQIIRQNRDKDIMWERECPHE